MKIYSILLLIASATLAVAAPALAEDGALQSTKVSVVGLDMNSHEGAAKAMKRIQVAAVDVCGGQPDIRQLDQQAAFESCRRVAVNNAVKSVDQPLLNQVASATVPPVFMAAR